MNLSEELISNFKTIIEIQKKKTYDMSNKDIWHNRMPVWFSKIIKNEKIDWDMLENFRGYGLLISEVPHRPRNWFKHFFRKLIRDPGDKKYCIENYKKLCSISYDKKLKDYSFSLVGNPGFYTHDGIKFNESAYIYNFKERKKQFLIFGFIIGLILSFTTLLSQKKLKE